MSPRESMQSAPLVFVVDDDARTTRRLAQMLTEDGFTAEALGDGRAAIERFARAPFPALIITDVVMPRAGGIAVFAEARRRWAGIPILFATGHPDLLARSRRRFEPPMMVLTKPVSYADLHLKIRELLAMAARLISA